MKAILIIFLIGGGGSGPRPAATIESIEFNTMRACKEALLEVRKHGLGSVGPRFSKTATCVLKGNEQR